MTDDTRFEKKISSSGIKEANEQLVHDDAATRFRLSNLETRDQTDAPSVTESERQIQKTVVSR